MEEIWKEVDGYEGLFISNHGRLRRVRAGFNAILKTRLNSNGYERARLQVDHQLKSLTIHRLVANAFIPNPDNKPQINHIDGNKRNNRVENLEWVTQQENIRHAIDAGLLAPPPCKPVIQYLNGVEVARHPSIQAAAAAIGARMHLVSRVAHGGRKRTRGYSFKFENATT